MNFLEVKNLTISFGNRVVVNNVSFDLAAGKRLGVIGESGSGKTMIALALTKIKCRIHAKWDCKYQC